MEQNPYCTSAEVVKAIKKDREKFWVVIAHLCSNPLRRMEESEVQERIIERDRLFSSVRRIQKLLTSNASPA